MYSKAETLKKLDSVIISNNEFDNVIDRLERETIRWHEEEPDRECDSENDEEEDAVEPETLGQDFRSKSRLEITC